MGTVFEAWHIHRNERCALKVVHPGHSERRAYLEGSLGQRDLGIHVVRSYDIQRHGPITYLVMEWVEGTNLLRLARATRLNARQVVNVARQACIGLAAIHAEEAVHRDIKPANLLVGVNGVVKVSDLGVVRTDDALHTDTRGGIGTRLFMSPEQRLGDPGVDFRSDLYSLGMTMYVLLGNLLSPENLRKLEHRLDSGLEPTSLADVAPDVDRTLVPIVDWCLARDPERRPADARVLRAALDALGWEDALVVAPERRHVPAPPDKVTLRLAHRTAFRGTVVDSRPTPRDVARYTPQPARRLVNRNVLLGAGLIGLLIPYVLGVGSDKRRQDVAPEGAGRDDAARQEESAGQVAEPRVAEERVPKAADVDVGLEPTGSASPP